MVFFIANEWIVVSRWLLCERTLTVPATTTTTQSEDVSVQTQRDPNRPVRFVITCARLCFLLHWLGLDRASFEVLKRYFKQLSELNEQYEAVVRSQLVWSCTLDTKRVFSDWLSKQCIRRPLSSAQNRLKRGLASQPSQKCYPIKAQIHKYLWLMILKVFIS